MQASFPHNKMAQMMFKVTYEGMRKNHYAHMHRLGNHK